MKGPEGAFSALEESLRLVKSFAPLERDCQAPGPPGDPDARQVIANIKQQGDNIPLRADPVYLTGRLFGQYNRDCFSQTVAKKSGLFIEDSMVQEEGECG